MKYRICMLALVAAVSGCMGGGEENTNNPQGGEEEFFAENVRSRVDNLKYTLEHGEGNKVAALKREFDSYKENPIDLENGEVGEHQETYEAIVKGMKELETMLNGSPSADDLKKKIADLKALTDKLPKMQGAGGAAG